MTLINDEVSEVDEDFTVLVEPVSDFITTASPSSATFTIEDDDCETYTVSLLHLNQCLFLFPETVAVVGLQHDSYTMVGAESSRICVHLLAKPPSAPLTVHVVEYGFICKPLSQPLYSVTNTLFSLFRYLPSQYGSRRWSLLVRLLLSWRMVCGSIHNSCGGRTSYCSS